MAQKKGKQKRDDKRIDAGKFKIPVALVDPEVQEEFREAQHRAGSGSQILKRKLKEHTSTGPELCGGDIDADWEDAESVGDEAATGDNSTLDQNSVDSIGEAMGDIQKDEEPLHTADEKFSRKHGYRRD
jgi:hypothetical protein